MFEMNQGQMYCNLKWYILKANLTSWKTSTRKIRLLKKSTWKQQERIHCHERLSNA